MTENEYLQNLRLALKEAIKSMRQIDSFFWVISSFWMAGTGVAVSKVVDWKGEDWKVPILGIIMLLVWSWYHRFLKDVLEKQQMYLKLINQLEIELGIDVLLKNRDKTKKKDKTKREDESNEKLFDTFPFAWDHKKVKAQYFSQIMVYMIYLSYVIWGAFIFEYIVYIVVKNWSQIATIFVDCCI